jgi:hypothetical protein
MQFDARCEERGVKVSAPTIISTSGRRSRSSRLRKSPVAPNAICRSRGRTRSSSSLSQASSPLRCGHDHLEPWRSGA